MAAAGEGGASLAATGLLGLLTVGLGHSLVVEIKRQARRESPGGWSREDTVNTVLLGIWAEGALIAAIQQIGPPAVQAVALGLALAYAACCGYFVTERRRAIADVTDVAEPVEEVAPVDHGVALPRRHPGMAGHAPTAHPHPAHSGETNVTAPAETAEQGHPAASSTR